jgi:hypothetical protein
MRKKTLDAQSFAGVSPSRARAHCNEHCLCVLLFFPDPDAPGTYNRQVKMRFRDDSPKLALVMRLPNEDPKTTLTKSLTRTSPIHRSKWGPKIRGSKTTLQNRSNEQVPSKGQNKVPKNEGPKTTLQNRWPEQMNRSHRQVEMRFPDEGLKTTVQKSLTWTSPIDRSKWDSQNEVPKTSRQIRSNEQITSTGQNEVPKFEGPKATKLLKCLTDRSKWGSQKLRPKNYPTKSLPWTSPSKWGFQNEDPKNMLQKSLTSPIHRSKRGSENDGPKPTLQNRSPEEVPSIDRSKWGSQKEGSKNHPTKSLSPLEQIVNANFLTSRERDPLPPMQLTQRQFSCMTVKSKGSRRSPEPRGIHRLL